MIYDGACKVCVRQVENIRRLIGHRFTAESFRDGGFFDRHPGLTFEECEKAIQLLLPSGKKFSGAEAVAQTVGLRKRFRPFVWLYYVPPFRRLWDRFYEWIAKNRFEWH